MYGARSILRRAHVFTFALGGEAVGNAAFDRGRHFRCAFRSKFPGGCERRDLRGMTDLIRQPTTDACHHALMPQESVNAHRVGCESLRKVVGVNCGHLKPQLCKWG